MSTNDGITLRVVDRFAEPQFSELVARLLHDPDRRVVRERFLHGAGAPPIPSTAQQIRIGAFHDNALIGWSHAYLNQGGVMHVANSAVVEGFRRRGIYSRLIEAVEGEAIKIGCLRVESHHQSTNSAVLIAKLKAGYIIVGTEFAGEMGLLVKVSKYLDPARQTLLASRAGALEASARFFGRGGEV